MGQTKKDLFSTMAMMFASFAITYIISFVLTSYITNNIGIDAAGFVNLSKNFVSYATIITTAINAFAVRFITVAYHQNDIAKVKTYFSSVFFADLVLGAIILFVALGADIYISRFMNVSAELETSVQLLFALVFISFFFTVVGTVFTSAAYIKNRLRTVYILKCSGSILEAVVLVVMYKTMTPKLWYVGLGLCLSALLILLGYIRMSKVLIPEIKIDRRFYSFEAIKELVGKGFWNSVNSLGNTLNSGLDIYISNIMLGDVAMGQVSIAKTIGGIMSTVCSTVSQPFQPELLRKYTAMDKEGLINDFKYSMKICGLVTNVVFAGFAALGIMFYKLWIPTQNVELIYRLTMITMLVAIAEGSVYPLYYIYVLTVKNKLPCFVTIAGGVLNVIGMIALIRLTDIGVYAIVITTAVIMNGINLIFNPLYMCHCLKVPKSTFYPVIFRNIAAGLLTTLILWFGSNLITVSVSWMSFVVSVLVCGVIALVLCGFLILGPNSFKGMITKLMRGVVKK